MHSSVQSIQAFKACIVAMGYHAFKRLEHAFERLEHEFGPGWHYPKVDLDEQRKAACWQYPKVDLDEK